VIVTGELGARVLAPLLPALREHAQADVELLAVRNDFFGGNIGVTGLLTGADVATALATRPPGERYLLPDVALSRGRFLDGVEVGALPRRVDVVPTDGASLVRALV
jgi:NifB/MoaA-like Fe-S oxidoreductase